MESSLVVLLEEYTSCTALKKRSVGNKRLAEKQKREGDIADAHCAYNSREHVAREELPPE